MAPAWVTTVMACLGISAGILLIYCIWMALKETNNEKIERDSWMEEAAQKKKEIAKTYEAAAMISNAVFACRIGQLKEEIKDKSTL